MFASILTAASLLATWAWAWQRARKPGEVRALVGLTLLGTAAAFRGWHVEDAGIVYAYARALAAGDGLVAGAGLAPVEGFSDPLWVALLTLAAALGLPLAAASKGLQLALSALAMRCVHGLSLQLGASGREAWLAALLAATSGAWAVWSTGGLEVALFGTLLVIAALASARKQDAMVVGLVAACAVTRPEGAIAGIIAACAGATAGGHGLRFGPPVLGATLGLAAQGALRIAWLGTVLPNTALAKLGGPAWKTLAVGVAYAALAALQVSLPWLWLSGRRSVPAPDPSHRAGAAVGLSALGLAVLMGGDWMRHARFLAPWVPLMAALLGPAALRAARDDRKARGLLIVAIGSGVAVFAHAVHRPTLPLDHGLRRGALYAAITASSCPEPSVATPDIGGVLHEQPQLRVTDFVGLVDAEAARNKREPGYWEARLRKAPPSIVDLHGRWAERTDLPDDTLRALNYRVLCRRGETPASPTLWLHDRCPLPLDPRAAALLARWCEQGSGVPWPELDR